MYSPTRDPMETEIDGDIYVNPAKASVLGEWAVSSVYVYATRHNWQTRRLMGRIWGAWYLKAHVEKTVAAKRRWFGGGL